jgi:hypothetical protein
LASNSRIGPGIRLAKKPTAMVSTSTISRRAIRGASFREFAFQLSPEFTWKESSAFDRRLTFTSDKDIEVTGQPIQTEIIPILKK